MLLTADLPSLPLSLPLPQPYTLLHAAAVSDASLSAARPEAEERTTRPPQ